jgi:hypothetical protein
MAALWTIDYVTGRRLVSSIYLWDIYVFTSSLMKVPGVACDGFMTTTLWPDLLIKRSQLLLNLWIHLEQRISGLCKKIPVLVSRSQQQWAELSRYGSGTFAHGVLENCPYGENYCTYTDILQTRKQTPTDAKPSRITVGTAAFCVTKNSHTGKKCQNFTRFEKGTFCEISTLTASKRQPNPTAMETFLDFDLVWFGRGWKFFLKEWLRHLINRTCLNHFYSRLNWRGLEGDENNTWSSQFCILWTEQV